MTSPGLIVIGSGPAGVAAAESFRLRDSKTPILLVSTDVDVPYERPPLSKDFLRGDTDDVALHPPEWFDERAIEVALGRTANAIEPDEHIVVVGGDRYQYTALVIATGAAPSALPVPGGEHAVPLRSLADADRLRRTARNADTAVVIGAGFIGCEAAASLAMRAMTVTIVAPERVPQEERLGAAAGERFRELVERSGARFIGGTSVRAIEQRSGGFGVHLDDGGTIDCDLVLAATGVQPNSEVAVDAGLVVDEKRMTVDADARTSAPDVYAAGDVARTYNDAARRHVVVEHWQDAVDQGTIAGANAAGADLRWDAVPGFWSTIGEATIKYHAWGDGYDADRLVDHGDGFTVWYARDGATVGVLTHDADDDYEAGEGLIAAGAPPPRA